MFGVGRGFNGYLVLPPAMGMDTLHWNGEGGTWEASPQFLLSVDKADLNSSSHCQLHKL